MKTSVFKLICIAFSITFFMSSCLGDGDSSFKNDNDLAFITSNSNGTLVANTLSAGYVTHEAVKSLRVGRCYKVAYKINTSQQSSSGFYSAESFSLVEKNPLPQQSLDLGKPYSNIPQYATDSIAAASLSVGFISPFDNFGDCWLFTYNVSLKEDEVAAAFFYYDSTNQKENGENLKANQAIVDVRIVKTTVIPGTQTATPQSFTGVGRLDELRSYLQSVVVYPTESKVVDVPIKFRYMYLEKSTSEPVMRVLGSWEASSSNTVTSGYYMRFSKE